MKPLNTTIAEVLANAIQSEAESRVYYQKLATRTSSEVVRKRLLDLADLQLVHRTKLERRYKELVKDVPPPAKEVTVEIPPDLMNLDLQKVLKIALEHERDSESNFRFLAERVPNTELGALFLELAEMEWQHKIEIQNEYNSVLDPEQFLLDI